MVLRPLFDSSDTTAGGIGGKPGPGEGVVFTPSMTVRRPIPHCRQYEFGGSHDVNQKRSTVRHGASKDASDGRR
jgi:hypothetical protein